MKKKLIYCISEAGGLPIYTVAAAPSILCSNDSLISDAGDPSGEEPAFISELMYMLSGLVPRMACFSCLAVGVWIVCQAAYADKLLDKMGMGTCNGASVPMEPRLKLSKNSSGKAVDATLYRSIVGGLRYLVHTRPDICFTVDYLSRYMEASGGEH